MYYSRLFINKIIFLLLCFLFFSSFLYGIEKSKDNKTNQLEKGKENKNTQIENEEKIKQYEKEKITLDIKKQFDALYPANINLFYLKKGEERITLDDFIKLSLDPYLLNTQNKIKRIRLIGFSAAGVFGTTSVIFLIPTIIFVALQTNNHMLANQYRLTGVVTLVLTGASIVGLLIDLIVTFSLLYHYKYNEYAVKQAVERYNEKLRQGLGIMPDISYKNDQMQLNLSFKF